MFTQSRRKVLSSHSQGGPCLGCHGAARLQLRSSLSSLRSAPMLALGLPEFNPCEMLFIFLLFEIETFSIRMRTQRFTKTSA